MIKLKDILNETIGLDILKKTPEEILGMFDYYEGFNSEEDALEYIEWAINTPFPDGFKNIPSEMTLYRVLLIQDGKKINENELGQHYIANPKVISDEWLEDIGIFDEIDYDDPNSELWLLTCKVPSSNFDIESTLSNRLQYPQEEEFTLKSTTGIRVVDKKKLNLQDYRL